MTANKATTTSSRSASPPTPNRSPDFQSFISGVRSYRYAKEATRLVSDKHLEWLFDPVSQFLEDTSRAEKAELADIKQSAKMFATVERKIEQIRSFVGTSSKEKGPWTKKNGRLLQVGLSRAAITLGREFASKTRDMWARKRHLSIPHRKGARQQLAKQLERMLIRILPSKKRRQNINSIIAAIMVAIGEYRSTENTVNATARIRHMRSDANVFRPLREDEYDEGFDSAKPWKIQQLEESVQEAARDKERSLEELLRNTQQSLAELRRNRETEEAEWKEFCKKRRLALKQRSMKKQPGAGKRQNSRKIKRVT